MLLPQNHQILLLLLLLFVSTPLSLILPAGNQIGIPFGELGKIENRSKEYLLSSFPTFYSSQISNYGSCALSFLVKSFIFSSLICPTMCLATVLTFLPLWQEDNESLCALWIIHREKLRDRPFHFFFCNFSLISSL